MPFYELWILTIYETKLRILLLRATEISCMKNSQNQSVCVCVHVYVCVCVCVCALSHVQLFATPCTVTYQAPLSMEFSRKNY